jgi:hypothetical protein
MHRLISWTDADFHNLAMPLSCVINAYPTTGGYAVCLFMVRCD